MTSELTFDEAKHEYWLDGRNLVSVTQVIRRFVPQWQAGEWYLTRGKAVHAAVALAIQGKLDWSSVDERIKWRVKSILNFVKETKLTTAYGIEQRIASHIHHFAGCLDYMGVNGKGDVLCDWKSAFSPASTVQCGAYDILWGLQWKRPERAAIVEIRDGGNYKVHWMNRKELTEAGKTFLHMLSVYNWLERNGLNKKEL